MEKNTIATDKYIAGVDDYNKDNNTSSSNFKIQTLQKEFLDKLRGMTIQDAKFVLEPVINYINKNSIVD
ncbi:hypothetical protein [Flavobacterium davisii]|uniref:hypothetical protein n=1 Tax=Flavobacterium davisii TaxID=2906077 RepID=UPI0035CEA0FF